MGGPAERLKDIRWPQPHSFDIERATKENTNYRSVAWSGSYLSIVTLMSIPVGGDIGLEAHPETDQFLRLDAGSGRVRMGAAKDKLTFEKEPLSTAVVLVPAGTWHNITNIGASPCRSIDLRARHHKPDKVRRRRRRPKPTGRRASGLVQCSQNMRRTNTGDPFISSGADHCPFGGRRGRFPWRELIVRQFGERVRDSARIIPSPRGRD